MVVGAGIFISRDIISVTARVTSDTALMARGTDLRSSGEALDCDQKAVPKPTLATRIQSDTVRECFALMWDLYVSLPWDDIKE